MDDRDLRTAIQTIADDVRTPPFSQIQRRSERNRRLRRASVVILPTGLLAAALLAFVIQSGLPVTGERAAGAPSAAPASSAPGVAATGSGSAQPGIDIQRSGSYKTVAALVADSSLVAYVTATSTHSIATVNGLPFTSTIMRIDRVIRGTAPKSDTLSLRQIGPANIADPPKIVEPGHQYLVFLGRVSFSPGTTTGEWYVVGLMAGLYEVADGKAIHLDDVRIWPPLPTDVPLSEFEAAIDAAPASSVPGVAATGSGSAHPGIAVSRHGSYKTVAALVADSSLVAIVTATSTHSITTLYGLPFTSTTMHIDRVIRGTAPKPDTLPLSQIGPANIADPPKIVEPGHQYLVFLDRVSFSPGTTTGEWYVVGYMAGLYEVAGGKAIHLDDVRIWPPLPTDVPLSEFEAAIDAAPTQKP